MFGVLINSGVNNYGGVPLIGANTFANRPTASIRGRLFVDTTNNLLQYDTGTAWVTIGGTFSGSGAVGQAAFFNSTSSVTGDNAFFWDNTNKRLGLGTTTPGVRLDAHGTGVIAQLNGTTTNDAFLDFQNAGTSRWRIGNNYNGGTALFSLQNRTTNLYPIQFQNDGSIMFGSTNFTNIGFLPFYYTFIREGNVNILNILTATNGGATGSALYLTTNRGANKSAFVATINGDQLANISINGSNNTGYIAAAQIDFVQSGASTATDVPCDIRLRTNNGTGTLTQLLLSQIGYNTFLNRLNVNNATDNALFELNVNGNTYTGGLSPTILTVSGNTTMARTATGYYCTATLTLTLPSAASINNVYWVIAGSGATITVNRAGTDDILNLAGTSVTSITISPNQRAMFYVGGGTRTFLIFQA